MRGGCFNGAERSEKEKAGAITPALLSIEEGVVKDNYPASSV